MTNEYENVNQLIATNDDVAASLAKSYGQGLVEQVYVLLSDNDFYDDLIAIRDQFSLQFQPSIKDSDVDQYIVDTIFNQLSTNEKTGNTQDINYFMELLGQFDKSLKNVFAKHKIGMKFEQAIKIYLVKGDVSALESVQRLITVKMDRDSKDLLIRVSSKSRNVCDLQEVMSMIYKSWNVLRPKPKGWNPYYTAKRDSEMSRYRNCHTLQETAAEFSEYKLEDDSIERKIRDIRKRRRDII